MGRRINIFEFQVTERDIHRLFGMFNRYRREYGGELNGFETLVWDNPEGLIGELGFDVVWAILFGDWEGNFYKSRARYNRHVISQHTIEQWEEKKSQYNYRCFYCGKVVKRLTQDHVIPISKGGDDTIDNIVPSCKSCNSRKHNRDIQKFKKGAMLKLL